MYIASEANSNLIKSVSLPRLELCGAVLASFTSKILTSGKIRMIRNHLAILAQKFYCAARYESSMRKLLDNLYQLAFPT